MRIKNFKTFQVLKLKTSNAWKLEGKIYLWNQCLTEILLLKKHFCINLQCKKVKFCIFVPCWKTRKEQKRIRKTNSNKNFESYSDFETAFLKELQFWNEKLKTCASSSQFFTTHQILNWDFYCVLEFEQTSSPPVNFFNRKIYNASAAEVK